MVAPQQISVTENCKVIFLVELSLYSTMAIIHPLNTLNVECLSGQFLVHYCLLQDKTFVYIYLESQQGGRHVKNLEIF